MFQKAIAAYHRLVKTSARRRRVVSLEVTALEERATPAATPIFVPLVSVPQSVLVGPNVVVAPSTTQSLVRLDLLGAGQSPPAHGTDDAADQFVQHRQEADAVPPAQTNAENLSVTEEELQEFLAAQQAA
jgi:hypothetical protein